MTVQSATTRVSFACDGSTKVFPVNIQAYQAADFLVILTAPASLGGGSSVLTLNSDYSLAPSGSLSPTYWTLTTLASLAYAVGYELQAILAPAQQQQTQYVQGQAFPSAAVQANLDRLTQMVLRLQDQVNRSIVAPDGDVSPSMQLPSAAARALLAMSFDSNGNLTLGTPVSGTISASLIATLLSAVTAAPPIYSLQRTLAEVSAGVTPSNYAYAPLDIRRYGAKFDGVTDDTVAWNNAIAVASAAVSGAQGATVTLPTGTSVISSTITLPNRVRIIGQNKRGTNVVAAGSWNSGTYPWMFHAVNGTSSMFDSTLEQLTVNAEGIAGLGCILSDAWQDDCGLRSVLLINFTTSGIKFQNGYGGADTCVLRDVEIFGNTIGAGTANSIGIDLSTAIGAVAAFKLNCYDVVIAGGVQNLAQGIWSSGNSLIARATHFEACTSGFYLDGLGFHSLEDCDGTGSVTSLVTLVSTYTGTLIMRNNRRNTATNLVNDLRAGGLGAISGYDVPLVIQTTEPPPIMAGAAWSGGTFTVSGGIVTVNGKFNCSISRTSAGVFVVTETQARPSTYSCAPFAQSNQQNAASPLQVSAQHTGASSYTINTSIAGTATDPTGEVNFMNLRLQ